MKTVFEAEEDDKWSFAIWENALETIELITEGDESISLTEFETLRLIERLQEAHLMIRKRRIAREEELRRKRNP